MPALPATPPDAAPHEDRALPTPPRGQTVTIVGTDTRAYIVSGAAAAGDSSRMLVLLTNSLGLESTNNLLLADRYADRLRCLVVVPDLFGGDPIPAGAAQTAAEMAHAGAATGQDGASNSSSSAVTPAPAPAPSLIFRVKSLAVSLVKGFVEDMWAARHTYDKTMPVVRGAVLELVAAYAPRKIAVVGYSFGARYALRLLAPPPGFQNRAWAGDETDAVTCGAVVHPSLLQGTPGADPGGAPGADFAGVNKPVFLVYSKDDELLPEATIKHGLRVLAENNVEVETAVYDNDKERAATPGLEPLPHGFAVPGDYPQDVVGDRPDNVFNLVASWISLLL